MTEELQASAANDEGT